MNPLTEMLPFERKVKDFISRHQLITDDSTVIIGLSGGADSVALTMVLNRLGYNCRAAHCNFHLRGDESDRDEQFVRKLTDKFGIPLDVIDFDVPKYISEAKRPTSLEMACRELRYDWFRQLRDKYSSQSVAVAHNADDNIETVLLNMLRGSGISGLRGMLPSNNSHVIRPLLEVYRQEIEVYLKEIKIDYVTDSTNLESDYSRNKLRNQVLPLLFSLFPDGKKGFSTTISLMVKTERFYKDSICAKSIECNISDSETNINSICTDPNAELLLFEWLRPHGISMEQVSEILANPQRSGKRFFCDNGYYLLDRGMLKLIEDRADEKTTTRFENLFRIEYNSGNNIEIDKSGMTAYFDTTVIDPRKLTFRYWRDGDRIKPFGLNGTKKLSDVFSDAKIPLNIKSRIPILIHEDEILWIPGLRASRIGKITENTTSYISIHYIGERYF